MEISENYLSDKSTFSLNLICSKISYLEEHVFYRVTQELIFGGWKIEITFTE